MTPLAAKLFRSGDATLREVLAAAQFFECSALYDMAREMVRDDLEAGCLTYSDMAHLPAPTSVFEFKWNGSRVIIFAQQQGEKIKWNLYGPEGDFVLGCGFRIGTGENDDVEADAEFMGRWRSGSGSTHTSTQAFASQQGTGLNGLLEKFLCMMNQPGLVAHETQSADKRVLREAQQTGLTAPDVWHRCRIRPGQHSIAPTAGITDAPVRPLHYVRKYFKPSVGKWVDGYWRGDISLGLHLKWYSPQPPRKVAP